MDDPGQQAVFGRFNHRDNLKKLQTEWAVAKQQQQRDQWRWRTDYPFAQQTAPLVDTIHAHPDVEFYLWFAPTSLGRYVSEPDMHFINRNVEYRRFLVKTLAGLPNVKLFGFDNELSITATMQNYMDVSHYNAQTQHRILQDMAVGNHRLTTDTIDAYVEQFRKNLLAYELVLPLETQK